ncbi:MAG TPA: sulfur carrier protein ThiS [Thermoanaerobaculia bacterium]|nr:sulfur carrier protein ThiS [Thermoanaerobaculia bacterium]
MSDGAAEIRVRVNGEVRAVGPATRVADLLDALGVATPRVAVEYNREILPKGQYEQTQLREGDELEVVTFVGGG